jgi:hypothetical protein
LDFRFVKADMALYHHIGDVMSTPFSPACAFSLIWLMIGVEANPGSKSGPARNKAVLGGWERADDRK